MRLRPVQAFAFLAPALLVYGLFLLYPALTGVVQSLTDSSGLGASRFVGLTNYLKLLGDAQALTAFRNVALYAVLVTVVQNALGLAFASALIGLPAVRNLLRVALITPSMIAVLIAGFIWSYIYSPLGGPLNALLGWLGLGSWQHVWLGEPATALLAVAAVNVWMFAGYSAAIFLAGYLSIPSEVHDGAAIDGAAGWRRFWYIDWPMLAPATTVNLTFTLIGSAKVFELPFVLTKGGPGDATQVPGLLIYQNAFSGQRFGYAAALAVVMAALVIVAAGLQSSWLRRREARL